MVPAPVSRTTLLGGPLVLVGPAAVTLRVSPASASLAVTSNLVAERTRLVFAVTPAVLSECVGGVFTTCTTLLVLPRKLTSPAYSALTVIEPCGRMLVTRVAIPLPSRTTGSPSATPLVLNCTLPVGVPARGGTAPGAEVKVTSAPGREGLGEAATLLVVLALVMVTEPLAPVRV